MLRFPSAIEINTFAKGRVELLHFRIPQGSILDGLDLYSMHDRLRCNVLVCTQERDGEMLIPQGNTVLRAGDVISIVAPIEEQDEFFRKIGLETHSVRNTIIIGGGDIALYLAKMLGNSGVQVRIIEKDLKRLRSCCPRRPSFTATGPTRSCSRRRGSAPRKALSA